MEGAGGVEKPQGCPGAGHVPPLEAEGTPFLGSGMDREEHRAKTAPKCTPWGSRSICWSLMAQGRSRLGPVPMAGQTRPVGRGPKRTASGSPVLTRSSHCLVGDTPRSAPPILSTL